MASFDELVKLLDTPQSTELDSTEVPLNQDPAEYTTDIFGLPLNKNQPISEQSSLTYLEALKEQKVNKALSVNEAIKAKAARLGMPVQLRKGQPIPQQFNTIPGLDQFDVNITPADSSSGRPPQIDIFDESGKISNIPGGAKLKQELLRSYNQDQVFTELETNYLEQEQQKETAELAKQQYLTEEEIRKEKQLISDDGLNNPFGYVANLGLGFVEEVASKGNRFTLDAILNAAKFGDRRGPHGIQGDDVQQYKDLLQKQENLKILNKQFQLLLDQRDADVIDADKEITARNLAKVQQQIQANQITPEQEALFVKPEKSGIYSDTYFDDRSKADRIETLIHIEETQDTIKDFIEKHKVSNRSDVNKANASLSNNVDTALEHFKNDDYLKGTAEVLSAFGSYATDEPAGAVQSFVETVPYMIALIAGGIPAIGIEAANLNEEATQAFSNRYGELPNGTEKAGIALLTTIAAALDRTGAVLTGSAGKQVTGLLKNSKKLNPKLTDDFIALTLPILAPAGSIAVEASTEVGQEALSDIAGSLRDPEINAKKAIEAGIKGGFAGGAFSVPGTVSATVDATKVAAESKPVKTAIESGKDIGTTAANKLIEKQSAKLDKLIKEQGDPKRIIKLLAEEPKNDPDVRVNNYLQLKIQEKRQQDSGASEQILNKTAEIIKAFEQGHKLKLFKEQTGKSLPEHIKIATLTEATTDISEKDIAESMQQVAKAIRNNFDVENTQELEKIEQTFGSKLFDNLSKEDKDTITKYVAERKAASEVSNDVLQGIDSKFKGMIQHRIDANTAIRMKDRIGIDNIKTRLNDLVQNQTEKIEVFKKQKELAEVNGSKQVFTWKDQEYIADYTSDLGKNSFNKLLKLANNDLKVIKETEKYVTDLTIPKGEIDLSTDGDTRTTIATSKILAAEIDPTNEQNLVQRVDRLNTLGVSEGAFVDGQQNKLPTQALEDLRASAITRLQNIEGVDLTQLQIDLKSLANWNKRGKQNKEQQVQEATKKKVNKEKKTEKIDTQKKDESLSLEDRQLALDIGEDITVPELKVVIPTKNTGNNKGSFKNTLTENLLDSIESIPVTLARGFTESKGLPVGSTIATVFEPNGKQPNTVFNTVHNFFSRIDEIDDVSKENKILLDKMADFNNKFSKRLYSELPYLSGKTIRYPERIDYRGFIPENKNSRGTINENLLALFTKLDSKDDRYLTENLIGLMSAVSYNWLGTGSYDTLFNDKAAINSILGQDTKSGISNELYTLLGNIGTSRTHLAEILGKEVTRNLGIKPKAAMDGDLVDKLALSIGETIIGNLVQLGLLKISSVNNSDLTRLSNKKFGEEDTQIDGANKTLFVRIATNEQDIPVRAIQDIRNALTDKKEFIEDIFGLTSFKVFPRTEPTNFVAKVIQNTIQRVPESNIEAIQRMQQVKWVPKTRVNKLHNLLSVETRERIQGVKDLDTVHVENRESQKAINDSIRREFTNYQEALDTVGDAFYFTYEAVSNMRVMLKGNMINPQASKLHRHLVGAESWKGTVPAGPSQARDNYKLAIAQGFGISIDKQTIEQSLIDFEDKILGDEVIQRAIRSVRALASGTLSETEIQQAEDNILTVTEGKEGYFTLEALAELVNYKENEAFETEIGLETDGVTNGVAHSLMQSMRDDSAISMLEATGIFTNSGAGKPYVNHKAKGNSDLYEQLGKKWDKALITIGLSSYQQNQAKNIGHILTKETQLETIEAIARDLSKDPSMLVNYGAATKSIVTSLGHTVVNKLHNKLEIISKLETLSERKVAIDLLIGQLEQIIPGIKFTISDYTPKSILEFNLNGDSTQQSLEPVFIKAVTDTYGKALESALEEQFGGFLEYRETVNKAMNAIFQVFNVKYTDAIKAKDKVLSPQEKLELMEQLRRFIPLVRTPTAKDMKDSLVVVKTTKTRDHKNPKKTQQVSFTSSMKVEDRSTGKVTTSKSITGNTSEITVTEPGVSGLVKAIQAIDASNILDVMKDYDALNIHDAQIASVFNITESTLLANTSFMDIHQQYILIKEVNDTFRRIFTSVKKDADKRKILAAVNEQSGTTDTIRTIAKSLDTLLTEITETRKDFFKQPNISVSQFALGIDSVHVHNKTDVELESLIDDVFKSIDPEAKGSSTGKIDFDTFQGEYTEELTAENSLQIFNDLSNVNRNYNTKQESITHTAHLKEVLTNLVNKVIAPIETIDFQIRSEGDTTYGRTTRKIDPITGSISDEKIYINAAKQSRGSLDMSLEETYVHETVHSALTYGIDNNFHTRKELQKLFNRVNNYTETLSNPYEIFLKLDKNNEPVFGLDKAREIADAITRYDYVFNNKTQGVIKSYDPETRLIFNNPTNAYLHEFAAFGLTNENFISNLAKIETKVGREKPGTNTSKLKSWYINLLDWISGRIFKTQDLNADKALRRLADQLVLNQLDQKASVLKLLNASEKGESAVIGTLENKVIEPLLAWSKKKAAKSENIVGRTAHVVLNLPTAYRSQELRSAIKKTFRNLGIVEDSFITKLIRELEGTTLENQKWRALLRQSKHLVDKVRKEVSVSTIRDIREAVASKEKISKEESIAITRTMYKTELYTLFEDYTSKQISEMVKDSTKLVAEIQSVKQRLINTYGSNGEYYIQQARGLGSLMATGEAIQASQMMNPHNIVQMYLVKNRALTGDLKAAEQQVEVLSTLFALSNTETKIKDTFAVAFEREYAADPKDNVFTFLADLHLNFKADSLKDLFKNKKALIQSGYIHETFNPLVDMKLGTLDDKAEFAKEGYLLEENAKPLSKDVNDTSPDRYLYVSKNNASVTRVKATVSITEKRSKGSDLEDIFRSTGSVVPIKDAKSATRRIERNNQRDIQAQFAPGDSSDPSKTYLVPIMNENGGLSGYRYIMKESNKRELLEMDERYDVVMGNMYGSIKDKVNSTDVNKQVVALAYEDYVANFANDPEGYTKVSVDSTDPTIKELFALLPNDMKKDMRDTWGSEEIYVRSELIRLIFGFRKLTLGTLGKNSDNKFVRKLGELKHVQNVQTFLNSAAVRQAEVIWQEIVQVAKVNIVIRNPAVLIGNAVSNFFLSYVKGIPVSYIIKHQAEALRALNTYQEDTQKRDSIARKLEIDDTKIKQGIRANARLSSAYRQRLEVALARVEDDITHNPVRELVDEGIFQSITEDIDDVNSPYGFKNTLLNKLESKLDLIPDVAKGTAKQAYLAEDTSAFKLLMKATQYSDFIARYAVYKYQTEEQGIAKDESIRDIIESFVNYDVPTSEGLQYMNDMGFLMFTKFLFRIQKIILKNVIEHPGRSMSLLLFQDVFGEVSDIADSNLMSVILGGMSGRANFFNGTFDSATELQGLNILTDVTGL